MATVLTPCLTANSPSTLPCCTSLAITRKAVAKPCWVYFGLVAEPEICGMPASAYSLRPGWWCRVQVADDPVDLGVDQLLRHDGPCFRVGRVVFGEQLELHLGTTDFHALAFSSSMARRAPFSLSLPRWACGPVIGATWPSLATTSGLPIGVAGVAAGFGSSFWPQADSAKAATTERQQRKASCASIFLLNSEGIDVRADCPEALNTCQ